MCHDGQRPGPESDTHLTPAIYEQLRLAMKADPSGFRELYRDYLAEAWQSLEALRESIRRSDAKGVRANAHYLKGSSMVLGAVHVAQEAAMIEQAADSGRLDDAAARLKPTEHCINQVAAQLVEDLGPEVNPVGTTAAAGVPATYRK